MKNYIFLLTAILFGLNSLAQSVGETFILNTDHNTQEAETNYIATDYLKLKNGFKFKAGQTHNSFSATIDTDAINYLPFVQYTKPVDGKRSPGGLVAAIPGSAGVSDIGGATYSIPINLPVGIAGMTPQLAVVYNSHAGNGLLGTGTNLSGLSVISRASHTPYFDDDYRAIQFDNNDAFMFNGSRMILTDVQNNIYQLENDNTIKIQALETEGTSFKRFSVTYNNGTIAEYGNTSDSRIKITGQNNVYMWRLNKITDVNGFYTEYIYEAEPLNGESWISEIKYTGNTGGENNTPAAIATFYTVSFGYETRPDPNFAYIGGYKVKQTQRLKTITANYTPDENTNSELYHYTFVYNETVLDKVQLTNSDDESVRETDFDWNSGITSATSDPESVQTGFSADYNGDGTADVLYYDNTVNAWELKLNQDGTLQTQPFTDNITPNSVAQTFDFNGDGKQDIIIRQQNNFVNSQPYQQAARYYFKSSSITSFNDNGYLALFNQTGESNTQVGEISDTEGIQDFEDIVISFCGDFDADTKDEVFFFVHYSWEIDYGAKLKTLKKIIHVEFDEENNKTETIIPLGEFANHTPDDILTHAVHDFTGDGIKDLMISTSSKVQIFSFENGQFNLYRESTALKGQNVEATDYNGDGVFEAINRNGLSFDIMYTSAGSGIVIENKTFNLKTADDELETIFLMYNPIDYNVNVSPVMDIEKWFAADINQDGKTEIIVTYKYEYTFTSSVGGSLDDNFFDLIAEENFTNTTCGKIWSEADRGIASIDILSGTYVKVFYENGTSALSGQSGMGTCLGGTASSFGGCASCANFYKSYIADYNNDGIFSIYDNGGGKILTLSDTESSFLASITDGMGNTTSFTYKNTTQQGDFYEFYDTDHDENETTHPDIIPFGGPIKLVETITQTNGLCAPQVKQYSYKGGMRHRTKGFLGFTEIQGVVYTNTTENNIQKPVLTVSKFGFDETYFFPKLTKKATYGDYDLVAKTYDEENNIFSKTISTYNPNIVLGNKRYLARTDIITNTEYYPGGASTTIITDNDYNGDGIVTQQKVQYEGTGNETITTYTNHTGGVNGIAYLPQTVATTYKRVDETDITETVDITYKTNGSIDTKTIFDGIAKSKIVTQYYYNDYGMPLYEEITAAKNTTGTLTETRTSAITTYTTNQRFVDYVTDQLGVETHYKYNNKWGVLEMQKTGDTPPTDTNYDVKNTIDNWGSMDETSSLSNIDGTGRHIVKSSTFLTWADDAENDNLMPLNTVYVKTVTSDGVADVNIYCDNTGRELLTTTAGVIGKATMALCNSKEYYADGKLWTETNSYHISEDNNNPPLTEFKYNEVWGYAYETILPYTGKVLTSFGSENGNKTVTTTREYSDGSIPDNASIQYYNAFGEIWKEEDTQNNQWVTHTFYADGKPKSSTPSTGTAVTFEYDLHGNQTKLTDPDAGTITYGYNGFGELLVQVYDNGNNQTTGYDNMGRVSIVVDDSADGTTSTIYNYYPDNDAVITQRGQLHTISNGDVQQEYIYDNMGRVSIINETIGSEQEIFSTQKEFDNYGRHLKTIYPSGFTTINRYNTNGDLEEIYRMNGTTKETIWQVTVQTALGQTDEMVLGNKIVNKEYDLNRRLTKDGYNLFTLVSLQIKYETLSLYFKT